MCECLLFFRLTVVLSMTVIARLPFDRQTVTLEGIPPETTIETIIEMIQQENALLEQKSLISIYHGGKLIYDLGNTIDDVNTLKMPTLILTVGYEMDAGRSPQAQFAAAWGRPNVRWEPMFVNGRVARNESKIRTFALFVSVCVFFACASTIVYPSSRPDSVFPGVLEKRSVLRLITVCVYDTLSWLIALWAFAVFALLFMMYWYIQRFGVAGASMGWKYTAVLVLFFESLRPNWSFSRFDRDGELWIFG